MNTENLKYAHYLLFLLLIASAIINLSFYTNNILWIIIQVTSILIAIIGVFGTFRELRIFMIGAMLALVVLVLLDLIVVIIATDLEQKDFVAAVFSVAIYLITAFSTFLLQNSI